MTDTLMVGVSGVRGIVGKDLTPDVVTRWARGFGLWVREGTSAGGPGPGASVVIGRDARTSGPVFAAAVTAGLDERGMQVCHGRQGSSHSGSLLAAPGLMALSRRIVRAELSRRIW